MNLAVQQTEKQKQLWGILRQRSEFSFNTLSDMGVSEWSITKFVKSWTEAGLIECHRSEGTRKFYRPVANRSETRLPGELPATREGNMWRAMRRVRQFTPVDLACLANAGDVEVTVAQARVYCRQLLAANVLRMTRLKSQNAEGPVFSLRRDLGPLPPRMRRVTALFDPNAQHFHHNTGGSEQ